MTFQSFPKSVTIQDKESVEIECEILGKPTNGKLIILHMFTCPKLYNITIAVSNCFVKEVPENKSHLTSFHIDVVWFPLYEIAFIAIASSGCYCNFFGPWSAIAQTMVQTY